MVNDGSIAKDVNLLKHNMTNRRLTKCLKGIAEVSVLNISKSSVDTQVYFLTLYYIYTVRVVMSVHKNVLFFFYIVTSIYMYIYL